MTQRTIVEIQTDITFYKDSKTNWQKAFDAIAKGGQSYSFRDGDATRELTRANLPEIRKTLVWIDNKLSDLATELAEAQGQKVQSAHVKFFRGV